jgi:putative ATPase
MVQSLFMDSTPGEGRGVPLADRMRPQSLDELVGQTHLIGEGKVLREMAQQKNLMSIILWGPPGTGKTTMARILAKEVGVSFVAYSAVLSGIKEIKALMAEAQNHFHRSRQQTVVFVDEIHRFNKAQQDAFLPYVESGVIILIGATTENPSFEVITALLSRAKVYVLNPLSPENIELILTRALNDKERGLGNVPTEVSHDLMRRLALYSNGDARVALNALEIAAALAKARTSSGKPVLLLTDIENAIQRKILQYDKAGEEHYNLISALHKSLRNSDPDAAMYWLGRMLEGGEDPVYIARRMVRFASEDVGLADVRALSIALDATEAVRLIGMPECTLALAEAAVYLSLAPKSNALYTGYSQVLEDVQNTLNEPPPLHIRNAPTSLMKDLGYGLGYQYAHDLKDKVADMECLPKSLKGRQYYRPTGQGMERKIQEVLQNIRELKQRGKRRSDD